VKSEELRVKREEGRGKSEEGRVKSEEGRVKNEEGLMCRGGPCARPQPEWTKESATRMDKRVRNPNGQKL